MKNPFKKKVKPVATELVKTEEHVCCTSNGNCEDCGCNENPNPPEPTGLIDPSEEECHGECVVCDELLNEIKKTSTEPMEAGVLTDDPSFNADYISKKQETQSEPEKQHRSEPVESIKEYEKIINPKFTEKIKIEFDYIFSVSEVKKIQNRLKKNRQKLQSYKEQIINTTVEIERLSKIQSKVNYQEQYVGHHKIQMRPNHQDDLILLCTIGIDGKGLVDRINGLKGKLSQLEKSSEDIYRKIYSDEELLLDGINDVGLELINMDCDCCKDLNFAIQYNGWTVNSVVYRNNGKIEYTRVDFVAEEDTFDVRTAFENLVYGYTNDYHTKQLAEQQIHDEIDREDYDYEEGDYDCQGDGDCEKCGKC